MAFSPFKNPILVGFYSYFSGDQSFITRFTKVLLEEDAADTVSYFSLVSHDLLVGLFFLQELWMLRFQHCRSFSETYPLRTRLPPPPPPPPKLHSRYNLLPPNTFTTDKKITYALEVSLVFFRISHNIPTWYDCVGKWW